MVGRTLHLPIDCRAVCLRAIRAEYIFQGWVPVRPFMFSSFHQMQKTSLMSKVCCLLSLRESTLTHLGHPERVRCVHPLSKVSCLLSKRILRESTLTPWTGNVSAVFTPCPRSPVSSLRESTLTPSTNQLSVRCPAASGTRGGKG